MDEQDIRILEAISRLETGDLETLEAETGIPKSTIHYRLDRAKENGVIENDLLDIDIESVGIGITVISEITASYQEGYHVRVGEKLSEVEGVSQVFFIMGDADFLVIAQLWDHDQVTDLIADYEAIDEVERSSSTYVILTIKDQPNSLLNYELETVLEQFRTASQ